MEHIYDFNSRAYANVYDSCDALRLAKNTREIDTAEAEISTIYHQVQNFSQELADALDEAVGKIARAYSKQGFCMAMDAVSMTSQE